ncbi:hypothetical protein P4O66_001134 [Electrophorus voltai]|uniref:Uncharacterized protein n=1 Tax=Electrophorus voltai TaxID=2609070 RepID=A0AAD8Z9N4_9TELE|nr:hypothetical protein P4O66_001134 [Electrophorus voltai]
MLRECFGPSHRVPSSPVQQPSRQTARDLGLLPEAELDYIKTLLSKLKDGKPLVLLSLMVTLSEYDREDELVGEIHYAVLYLQYLTCPKPHDLVKIHACSCQPSETRYPAL